MPKTKQTSRLPDEESSVGSIVKDYLSRFPDAPALTLAKLIHRSHPTYFKSVEAARDSIRYYIGQRGHKNRNELKDHSFVRKSRPAGYIPKSEREIDWKPFVMQDGPTLVLSDIHVPFHDENSLRLAVKSGLEYGCKNVLINGDLADCHQLSRFSKRPGVARYQHERDCVALILHWLRDEFPKGQIVWKLGNHEERLEDYLLSHALAFWEMSDMSYENIFQLDQTDTILIRDKSPVMMGPLVAMHGHEFTRGVAAPVNPARGFFMKSMTSMIGSHHHQTSNHVEKTLKDKMISTWSTGCLCDLHPRYSVVNKWNHGFAIVRHSQKEFEVESKRIYKEKVW